MTNVKSVVGPPTTVISLDAGSESTHPASQCSLAHLNLCSAEILGESPHVTSPSCVSMFAQPKVNVQYFKRKVSENTKHHEKTIPLAPLY